MKPWRLTVATVVAFVFAILVPALLVVGSDMAETLLTATAPPDPYFWLRSRNFALLAVLISAAHVVLLGCPVYWVVRACRPITWLNSVATGFVLGGLPVGIFTWPLGHSAGESASYLEGGKMIHAVVDGVPTAAGWMDWLRAVGTMGALGAIGGLSFWLAWRGFARLLDCSTSQS